VITSSMISRTPFFLVDVAEAGRKLGAGGRLPCCGDGLTMMAGFIFVFVKIFLPRSDRCRARLALVRLCLRTPGHSAIPTWLVLNGLGEKLSACRVAALKFRMKSRLVNPRARRTALMVASVPLETKRIFSIVGMARVISVAS